MVNKTEGKRLIRKKSQKIKKPKKNIDYRKTLPDKSLEEIIDSYRRLIYDRAKKHLREGVELEDLVSEGIQGVIEAYNHYKDPNRKIPSYTFHQACLYKLQKIFYYCLQNASPLKTPVYVRRGCMHVGQIFKILRDQNVAEELFERPGPATENEIIDFIYDPSQRMPTLDEINKGESEYTIEDIKGFINKPENDQYFDQILDGVLHHRNGNRHGFVKGSLTNKGKLLHIKNKLYFSACQNQMKYERVIELILSARVIMLGLESGMEKPSESDLDVEITKRRVISRGKELVGDLHLNMFVDSVLNGLTYGDISKKYGIPKTEISEIIGNTLNILKNDEIFIQLYKELN